MSAMPLADFGAGIDRPLAIKPRDKDIRHRMWSATDSVLERGGTYIFEAAAECWDASVRYDMA